MATHGRATVTSWHTRATVWKSLQSHYKKLRGLHMRDLFRDDRTRGERMTAQGAGLYFDYSKNRITDNTIKLLVKLAEESGLQSRIDAMFRGEQINITEHRSALHIALRAPRGSCIYVGQENVVSRVHAVLDKMTQFANRIRSGELKGHNGKRIRNMVNLGTGGAGLGPLMAYEALKHYRDRSLTFRFISNIDSTDFKIGR